MKDDYTTNSHNLTYAFLFRVGRMYCMNLPWECKGPAVHMLSSNHHCGWNTDLAVFLVALEAPNDTKATLLYIKSTFPVQVFAGKIPAIMLKHQVYSILKDKTLVDRQLVSGAGVLLQDVGCITFKSSTKRNIIIYCMLLSIPCEGLPYHLEHSISIVIESK